MRQRAGRRQGRKVVTGGTDSGGRRKAEGTGEGREDSE